MMMRTNIGFVGSVSNDPKYMIPPTKPSIAQGIVTAYIHRVVFKTPDSKKTNTTHSLFPIFVSDVVWTSSRAMTGWPSLVGL
jgi:hypothetical protein